MSLALLQVSTRAESPVAVTCQDRHPGFVVFLETAPGAIHLGMRGQMKRVASFRATNGEDRNAAVSLRLVRKELKLLLLCSWTHRDTPIAIAGVCPAGSVSGPSKAPRARRMC